MRRFGAKSRKGSGSGSGSGAGSSLIDESLANDVGINNKRAQMAYSAAVLRKEAASGSSGSNSAWVPNPRNSITTSYKDLIDGCKRETIMIPASVLPGQSFSHEFRNGLSAWIKCPTKAKPGDLVTIQRDDLHVTPRRFEYAATTDRSRFVKYGLYKPSRCAAYFWLIGILVQILMLSLALAGDALVSIHLSDGCQPSSNGGVRKLLYLVKLFKGIGDETGCEPGSAICLSYPSPDRPSVVDIAWRAINAIARDSTNRNVSYEVTTTIPRVQQLLMAATAICVLPLSSAFLLGNVPFGEPSKMRVIQHMGVWAQCVVAVLLATACALLNSTALVDGAGFWSGYFRRGYDLVDAVHFANNFASDPGAAATNPPVPSYPPDSLTACSAFTANDFSMDLLYAGVAWSAVLALFMVFNGHCHSYVLDVMVDMQLDEEDELQMLLAADPLESYSDDDRDDGLRIRYTRSQQSQSGKLMPLTAAAGNSNSKQHTSFERSNAKQRLNLRAATQTATDGVGTSGRGRASSDEWVTDDDDALHGKGTLKK